MNLKFKLTKVFLIIPLLWSISVLSFLNYMPISLNLLLTFTIAIYLLSITYKLPNSIYFLPYLIILSPIFGSIKILGFNLLLSDSILIFSFLYMLYSKGIGSIQSKKAFIFLVGLSFFTFLHFVIQDLISIKPLFSIFELFFVYFLMINSKDNFNYDFFLNHFCFSVFIGIILMFLSFYNGVNLNDFSGLDGDASKLISEAKEFNAANFRMPYFYTNFPFLISITIFVFLYKIGIYKTYILKFFFLILVILTSLALVASGNKTTMVTTLIVFFLSNIYFRNIGIYKLKTFVSPIIFLPIIYFLVFNYYITDENVEGFIKVMTSLASVVDRIGVYGNAILVLLQNPFRLLTGFGPDFLTCCGDPVVSRLFKGNLINVYTINNAVDSGILTFIIEFGIILVIVVFKYLCDLIKNLTQTKKPVNIMFAQFFIVLLIYSIPQLVGLGKISWIIVVFLVMSKNYKINSLKS